MQKKPENPTQPIKSHPREDAAKGPFYYIVKFLNWIYKGWTWLGEAFSGFGRVVFLCRVSIINSIFAFVLLGLMPQGHEIGNQAEVAPWWFFGSVVVASLYNWLWARVLLNQEYGRLFDEQINTTPQNLRDIPYGKIELWAKWLPRFIAMLPSLAALIAVKRAYDATSPMEQSFTFVGIGIAVTIGVFLMAWHRRKMTKWLLDLVSFFATKTNHELATTSRNIIVPTVQSQKNNGGFKDLTSLMKTILILGFVIPLGFLIAALKDPATVGFFLGSSVAFFIAEVFAVSFLSGFVFLFNSLRLDATNKNTGTTAKKLKKSYDFPVILTGLFFSAIIPAVGDSNRFAVPALTDDKNYSGKTFSDHQRITTKMLVEKWFQHHKKSAGQEGKSAESTAGKTIDLVIVASTGGALRAATWTSNILARLQDNVDKFDEKLLAISGVSGGSLGATTYLAALKEKRIIDSKEKQAIEKSSSTSACSWQLKDGTKVKIGEKSAALLKYGCFQNRLTQALNADFLAPTLLGLLSNDIFLAGLSVFGTKDRGEALEDGWSKQWADSASQFYAKAKGDPAFSIMGSNFFDLWDEQKPWPALYLNGTHQQVGSRIITSNIKISNVKDQEHGFTDAYDFFDLRKKSISASTAAHNSARFSYVSPSGKITNRDNIIDGGYFENYGAETAIEILKFAVAAAKSRLYENGNLKIRIHIVQIVSDPSIPPHAFDIAQANPADGLVNRNYSTMVLGQYLAPIQGVVSTREARGMQAAKRLRQKTEKLDETPGIVGHFYLLNMGFKCQEKTGPALNWYMPDVVRNNLLKRIYDDQSYAGGQILELINRLNKAK